MPNALRTDTRVSGRPGAGWDPTMACTEFIGPPHYSAARRERLSHTRIPGARKKRALTATSQPPEWRAVPRAPTLQSDELIGAQEIVGLDDLAQSFFRRTIAPVRVRMMAFDQFLISRFDFRWGRVATKFERQQGLDRESVVARRRLGLRWLAFRSAPACGAGLGKNRFINGLAGRRGACAHLPGWTVADRVGLAVPRHGGVVHAAKVVIRSVVFPHVIAAKAEILALALAALRRAEHSFGRAAGERTRRGRRLFRRALGRLDPDTVEQTRVQIHAMTFMTANAMGQARNARRHQKPANRVPIGDIQRPAQRKIFRVAICLTGVLKP